MRRRVGGTGRSPRRSGPGSAVAAIALSLAGAGAASAHLGNISYTDIDIADRGAVMRLKYAAHMTPGYPNDTPKLSRAQILELRDDVQRWIIDTVELRIAEGACTPAVDNLIGPDLNDDLQAIVVWKCPAERVPWMRVSFRAFDGIVDDWQNIASVRFAGHTYSTVFTAATPRLTVGEPPGGGGDVATSQRGAGGGDTAASDGGGDGASDAPSKAAGDDAAQSAGVWDALHRFFELGVEHIWTGYDHLLFLFGVLLGGGGLRRLVAIVTSFTIAHSITLGLAALGLVTLPSGPVELIIALSIVYVAVENILGWGGDHRALVTFLFGLIHGFGFAGILAETGLPPGGVAVPLLAFNLGVEFGQLVVLAAVVPIMRLCLRGTAARPLTIALSSLIAAAGLLWAFQRI